MEVKYWGGGGCIPPSPTGFAALPLKFRRVSLLVLQRLHLSRSVFHAMFAASPSLSFCISRYVCSVSISLALYFTLCLQRLHLSRSVFHAMFAASPSLSLCISRYVCSVSISLALYFTLCLQRLHLSRSVFHAMFARNDSNDKHFYNKYFYYEYRFIRIMK